MIPNSAKITTVQFPLPLFFLFQHKICSVYCSGFCVSTEWIVTMCRWFNTAKSRMTVLIHFHEVALRLQTFTLLFWLMEKRAETIVPIDKSTQWKWFNLLLLCRLNSYRVSRILIITSEWYSKQNKNCAVNRIWNFTLEPQQTTLHLFENVILWSIELSTHFEPSFSHSHNTTHLLVLASYQHCIARCNDMAMWYSNEMFEALWFNIFKI